MKILKKLTYKNVFLMKHEFIENTSNLIQLAKRDFSFKQNYIAKVEMLNYDKETFNYHNLNEGDLVLLTKHSEGIKKHSINNRDYSLMPMIQVAGVFRNNEISYDSLEMLDDKLLVEEINLNSENNIQLPDAKFGTVGKVLKAGKGGFFKNFIRKSNQEVHEGDIILYWNNSQTKIQLDGKNCSIVEYYAVIGVFVDGIMHFDFLNLLDGRVLLEEYKFEKINNSILYVPELQEDEKYAYDTNNRFKVVKVCKRGKEIYKGIFEDVEVNEGDIVVVQRAILNYVDFKCKRYYTPEEMSSIEAVIYS